MMQDPQAHLARKYVEEFLRSKGLSAESVRDLPPEIAHRMMVDASTYAALKLAEVEKKSQIVQDLHGGPTSD
jgi:hypothetical protein